MPMSAMELVATRTNRLVSLGATPSFPYSATSFLTMKTIVMRKTGFRLHEYFGHLNHQHKNVVRMNIHAGRTYMFRVSEIKARRFYIVDRHAINSI